MIPIVATSCTSRYSAALSARTPQQAVGDFLGPFRQAIACVTNAVLLAGYQPMQREHALVIGGSSRARGSTPLRGKHDVALRLLHGYQVGEETGTWVVHTASYAYELLLADGREIVSYHYHPTGVSPVTSPHLHAKGLTAPLPLGRAHIPTGRVCIEAVVRFVITELGIEPRRPDWEAVLARGEAEFNARRHW